MSCVVQLTYSSGANVQDTTCSACLQCLSSNCQVVLGKPNFPNPRVLLDILRTVSPRSVLDLGHLTAVPLSSDNPTEQDVFGFGKQGRLPPSSLNDEALVLGFPNCTPATSVF